MVLESQLFILPSRYLSQPGSSGETVTIRDKSLYEDLEHDCKSWIGKSKTPMVDHHEGQAETLRPLSEPPVHRQNFSFLRKLPVLLLRLLN